MNREGKIIYIDDDEDDIDFFLSAYEVVKVEMGINNIVMPFRRAADALNFLMETDEFPFIIIADINMPKTNGYELRQIMINDLQSNFRFLPFVFFSTSLNAPTVINGAYELYIQGFFEKPSSVAEYHQLINDIIRYWRSSKTPLFH